MALTCSSEYVHIPLQGLAGANTRASNRHIDGRCCRLVSPESRSNKQNQGWTWTVHRFSRTRARVKGGRQVARRISVSPQNVELSIGFHRYQESMTPCDMFGCRVLDAEVGGCSDHDMEPMKTSTARERLAICTARKRSRNSAGINGASIGSPAASSTISARHRGCRRRSAKPGHAGT